MVKKMNKLSTTITKIEVQRIANRISALSEDKIDQLWFRLGFIYKRCQTEGELNDAIDERRIRILKDSKEGAYKITKELVNRISIASIKETLNDIENEPATNSIDILNETEFTNQSGEKISRKELGTIASRIRCLPDKKIDELWYKMGFIYSKKGKNKALNTRRIKDIKKSTRDAEIEFLKLFEESQMASIRKNLSDIEYESNV